MDESLKKTLDFLQKVADRFGYVLNPNEKSFERTATYMAANKQQHDKHYCPCKQHHPVDEKADPVCPCPEFHDEIKAQGHCECHIFFDKDAAAEAKRRPGLLATIACPG